MNSREFKTRIMPKYFRLSQYPSFIRQLNFYGFKRLENEPDKAGYYHPSFLREKRFLAKTIKRPSTRSKAEDQSDSADSDDEDSLAEPNLHTYPCLPQVGEGEEAIEDALDARPYATLSQSKQQKDGTMEWSSSSDNSTCHGEGKQRGNVQGNEAGKNRKDVEAVETPFATHSLPVVESGSSGMHHGVAGSDSSAESNVPKDTSQQSHSAQVESYADQLNQRDEEEASKSVAAKRPYQGGHLQQDDRPKKAVRRDNTSSRIPTWPGVPTEAPIQSHGVPQATSSAETTAHYLPSQQHGLPPNVSQHAVQLVNGQPLQMPTVKFNVGMNSNQAGMMMPVSA